MKIKNISILTSFAALAFTANALLPKTELQPRWLRVTDVERTDSATRVGIRLQNIPNYWVRYNSSARLIADGDTTLQYKLIGTENIDLDKEIWMPASCKHEGVLLFEKVPESIKVVDMVESNIDDVNNNVIGMHLDEAETRTSPAILTMEDIIKKGPKKSEPWTGLDPSRYSDLSFYDKNGKAHIKGRITDYSPRCGFSTVSVTTYNDFIGSQKVNVSNIASDGSFEMDVPVSYPQFDALEFGKTYKNIFLMPGDTISIATCLAVRPDPERGYVAEYFGYEGTPTESSVINLLADSLINRHYGVNNLWGKYYVAESDSMATMTYQSNERLGNLLDSVVSDLPKLLGDLPVSSFAKDVLSSYAIGKIGLMMDDIEMNFGFAKGPRLKVNEEGELEQVTGETLDIATITAPKLRHKELILDNPLLLCNSMIQLNRWEYNDLFRKSAMASSGSVEIPGGGGYISTDDPSLPFKIADSYLDSISVGNCFPAQLVQTKSFINRLNTFETPSSKTLERINQILPNIIKRNNSEVMNTILMEEYNGFVKDVLIAENAIDGSGNDAIIIDGSAEGEVLEKIIAPYRGNVLFLDFWGIGCGPCRSGMVSQKPMLEELADKPFRALYIANADEGLDACKKWLRKEDIKGEHIFVSNDDWLRLRSLFNFSGIPFGVLICKDGKVLKTGYHFSSTNEVNLLKALEEK
ncbi:MAG: TlpA family protein disulfide reductase [Muribaculaceae bacterium]|nr:TlpA family protein disulfide reductase [Muribaculaceae bacterium]